MPYDKYTWGENDITWLTPLEEIPTMKKIVLHVGAFLYPQEQEDWQDETVVEMEVTFAQFFEICKQGARTELGSDGLLHIFQDREG